MVPADINLSEVRNLNEKDVFIPAGDIRIWIDPLDATQEYTGREFCFIHTHVDIMYSGFVFVVICSRK